MWVRHTYSHDKEKRKLCIIANVQYETWLYVLLINRCTHIKIMNTFINFGAKYTNFRLQLKQAPTQKFLTLQLK